MMNYYNEEPLKYFYEIVAAEPLRFFAWPAGN